VQRVIRPSPPGPATAGYSGTPLAKKLGIKAGSTLLLAGAAATWEVPDLPDDVTVRRRVAASGQLRADVVLAFFGTAQRFRERAPGIARRLAPGSSLWVARPRRAGGHVTDLGEQELRDVLLPLGLVDVKVAALDTDWSGLKFVWRRTAGTSRPA
jgi:hypothetical protein